MTYIKTVLLLPTLFSMACGGTVQDAGNDRATDDPISSDTSSAMAAEVIAKIETANQHVYFLARPSLDSEQGADMIDVAIMTAPDAVDEASPLQEDGATPLEIYKRFAPQGTETPDRLLVHHEHYATARGRELAVREYSRLPLVGGAITDRAEVICFDVFSFTNHVSSKMTIIDQGSDSVGTLRVQAAATTSNAKDVYAYACNKTTLQMGCNADEKWIRVMSAGNGGGSVHWNHFLPDCWILKYIWDNRKAGMTYMMDANEGYKFERGSTQPIPAQVLSFHAIGYQK